MFILFFSKITIVFYFQGQQGQSNANFTRENFLSIPMQNWNHENVRKSNYNLLLYNNNDALNKQTIYYFLK